MAAVLSAFAPGKVSDVAGVTNPLGIRALRPVLGVVEVVMVWTFPVAILSAVASLTVRFWRSRGEKRQQMNWLPYAVAAMSIMILVTNRLDAMNSVLYPVTRS